MSIIEQFFQARKKAKQVALREKSKPDYWPFYNESLAEYEDHFKSLTKPYSIRELVKLRKSIGKSAFVLVAFGGQQVIKELTDCSGGIAVGLSKEEAQEMLEIASISEDIFRGKTSKLLKEYLAIQDLNLRGFDLILCAPIGGWKVIGGGNIVTPPSLQWLVANRLWNILSNDEGIMLIEFNSINANAFLPDWHKRLQKIKGMEETLYDGNCSMKFIRRKNSPRDLPRY